MIWRSAVATVFLCGPALAECAPDVAELRWSGGQVRFSVEIADTPAERAEGLMNRASLPRDRGMLFVYDAPQPVSFWMRNTLIPLDMLFIAADGTVTRIKDRAQPLDETPILGGAGVQFVLEINGGQAGELGLPAGAELRHPAIATGVAKWACDAP